MDYDMVVSRIGTFQGRVMKSARIIGILLLLATVVAVLSAFVHDRMMHRRIEMWQALAQAESVPDLSSRLADVRIIAFNAFVDGYVIPGPIEWSTAVGWAWPPVRLPTRQKIVIVTNQAMTSVDGVVLIGSSMETITPIETGFDSGMGTSRLRLELHPDPSGRVNGDVTITSRPESVSGSLADD